MGSWKYGAAQPSLDRRRLRVSLSSREKLVHSTPFLRDFDLFLARHGGTTSNRVVSSPEPTEGLAQFGTRSRSNLL
jgi:hypothetical protein